MTDADRRAQLLAIWLERPEDERTAETGIMNFYLWVRKYRPNLLVTGKGDPYQHLRNDLAGHIN
jgi:hypothetical protein